MAEALRIWKLGTGELSAVSSNEEASAIGGLSSQGSGGAIVNNGTLKIQNGIISGNKAKEGGTVTQNEAFQYGGVVISPCRVHNKYVIISS